MHNVTGSSNILCRYNHVINKEACQTSTLQRLSYIGILSYLDCAEDEKVRQDYNEMRGKVPCLLKCLRSIYCNKLISCRLNFLPAEHNTGSAVDSVCV